MKYHHMFIRMVIMKNTKVMNVAMMWRKWNPYTLLVGMQITKAIMENMWNCLRKLKIELLNIFLCAEWEFHICLLLGLQVVS
jgi:hypothetical protein